MKEPIIPITQQEKSKTVKKGIIVFVMLLGIAAVVLNILCVMV